MTKQEIEKAIKNGESVWGCLLECLLEICNDNTVKIDENIVGSTEINEYGFNFIDLFNNSFYLSFKDVYKTKAEAEHYLKHANITRTEQLPFYTFSEIAKDEKNFKMGKTYTLIEDKNFVLDINKSYVSQIVLYTGKEKYSWNFNEANFYKAYDECVRLFKGEE